MQSNGTQAPTDDEISRLIVQRLKNASILTNEQVRLLAAMIMLTGQWLWYQWKLDDSGCTDAEFDKFMEFSIGKAHYLTDALIVKMRASKP